MRLSMSPIFLILDEPTSGLDPNQIRQVRDLIKQLGTAAHHSALDSHSAGSGDDLQPHHHHQSGSRSKPATRRRICFMKCARRPELLEAKTGNDNGIEQLKKIAGVKDVSPNE